MKLLLLLEVSVLATLLSGCVGTPLVLDAVGPVRQPVPKDSNSGSLTVYSAFDAIPRADCRVYSGLEYSDYKIFYLDGKLLQRVHNSTDTIIEAPVTINLPPGKYNVVAKANGYGEMTVPVIIKADQQTVLHLEGGDAWSESEKFHENDWVRLPDGRAVGFKGSP